MKHVALLRGINVGGKNKLPMKDLAAIFTGAGCRNVSTFIQSGNVTFEGDTAGLAARIEKAIEKKFGFRPPVQFRNAAELRRVARNNPFINEDEAWLHVYFLDDPPTRSVIATLDPDRSPGDRFHISGKEIYLHLPNGMARTKLTNAWFDSKLSTISTARNWRTTLTLLELVSAS